ncbi:MAG: biopolymer transporter ExbD [Acidobacteria bacterium]|nr:biopolymer transporter ExbD [Acidobacteriota bacterium]
MIRPDINVTPLIDVLLVLLIIFMIITPERSASMNARVPSEPKNIEGVKPHPLTLVVSIGSDASLTLNSSPLDATASSPEALISRLDMVFSERTSEQVYAYTKENEPRRIEKTVFIKAPRSLDYGSVAKVIDAVRSAGAEPVSLQIDNIGQ